MLLLMWIVLFLTEWALIYRYDPTITALKSACIASLITSSAYLIAWNL